MMSEAAEPLNFVSGQSDYQAKLQLAPVVDLVLFLIWFYLLVGQLVIHQKDAAVALPQMASALARGEVPAELVINLRADSAITVDGTALGLAELRQLTERELAKARSAQETLRVVVRADRRQRFGALEELLRACRQAGVEQVVFRATEGGGS